MGAHTPETAPSIPPAPATDMMCWTCNSPQLFEVAHTGEVVPDWDALGCVLCHRRTRLQCRRCGAPYRVQTFGRVREPGTRAPYG